MYRLVSALIADQAVNGSRVLIAGAGGGREIEALGAAAKALDITAVDPSNEGLSAAKRIAERTGASDRINFFGGTMRELPSALPFDFATSLLVMHNLGDDGAKSDYLSKLYRHLAPGGVLLHADVCCDGDAEIQALTPAYMATARQAGVAADVARIERDAVSRLPVISVARTAELFAEAGFSLPREIFRSLWYRCWICTRPGP
ncbi:class I SAM-dependent methyltransferase [Roseovarius sp. CAU 1744]|uniref:class I SAM-dependent methyltransferase n=1 Tax=Roseovarius sp. CAU 1744 TaxID=3140368 RepID=UPI00325BAC7B